MIYLFFSYKDVVYKKEKQICLTRGSLLMTTGQNKPILLKIGISNLCQLIGRKGEK